MITATAAWADHRPALTWEGEVSGTVLLRIQGERVDVDARNADAVSRTNYRFNTPLAAAPDRITVENRQGGGRARVLEQPRRNNDFTALVEITSRNRGSQFMSLDFYWDDRGAVSRNRNNRDSGYGTRSRANDRLNASGSGTARWSGEVDNEVFVLLRGRQILNTAVRGRSVYGQQADVSTPLPRRPVTVSLLDVQGRGQIELVEQPDQNNNFTAKIRVVDPQAGAGSYSFTLGWDESGAGYSNSGSYSSGGGILSPGGGSGGVYNSNIGTGSARWTGQVDGRVRVTFRDNQAYAQRISGQEVYGEQASFGSSMPRRAFDVDVNKLRGRGDVSILQQPSPQNNYSLVIEINDRDSGSDTYDLEVSWR